MSDRLRIQKQMNQLKDDFPFLAQYLEGWPASTHGTQVLGLAEMMAKEMIGDRLSRPLVYGAAPKARSESREQVFTSGGAGFQEGSDPQQERSREVSVNELSKIPGRRKVGLGGVDFE